MENSLLLSSNGRNPKACQTNKKQPQAETPFEILCAADEQINPAIILAEALMRKNLAEVFDFVEIERAEEVLVYAREEIGRTQAHFTDLVKTHPTPANSVPLGF